MTNEELSKQETKNIEKAIQLSLKGLNDNTVIHKAPSASLYQKTKATYPRPNVLSKDDNEKTVKIDNTEKSKTVFEDLFNGYVIPDVNDLLKKASINNKPKHEDYKNDKVSIVGTRSSFPDGAGFTDTGDSIESESSRSAFIKNLDKLATRPKGATNKSKKIFSKSSNKRSKSQSL